MKKKTLLAIFIAVCFLALIATIYLTVVHYDTSSFGTHICDISVRWSCSDVSYTKYAYFFDVPVAVWGLITYIFLLVVSFVLYPNYDLKKLNKEFKSQHIYELLFYVTGFGVLFSLYLTVIEAFVIKTFCLFCVIQQVLIIILFILALIMRRMKD